MITFPTLPWPDWAIAGAAVALAVLLAIWLGRWSARRGQRQRLVNIAERLSFAQTEAERIVATWRPGAEDGTAGEGSGGGDGDGTKGRDLKELRGEALVGRIEHLAGAAVAAVGRSLCEATRFRRSLDALRQGVVIHDENGDDIYRNTVAERLLGGHHSDLVAARAIGEILGTTQPTERTLELYGPPRRTLVIRSAPLDDGRDSLGVVAVFEDISERRRVDSIRRDFVANVSHELKTPIAGLALLAETLASEDDPAVTQRLARRMHFEAERAARVISDLLDLSRIEAEESPGREAVAASSILGEVLDRIRSVAEAAHITVEHIEGPENFEVVVDRPQFVSAMNNLLENAVKYSEPGGKVVLRASREGPWAHFSVKDEGIGIPARDLDRIFERFYRVDQARSRQTGGTGLGLAIVRHVAANHGGTVEVESREGEGSTFTIRIPCQAPSFTPVATASSAEQ